MSNTLCIANEGNEADSCFKTKENGFVLSSLGQAKEIRTLYALKSELHAHSGVFLLEIREYVFVEETPDCTQISTF